MSNTLEQPKVESRKDTSLEGLKALLVEVNALANQLRRGADEADPVRQGGKTVLKVLGGLDALTVPEIARVRSTSRQNIQVLVNRLSADGCVELVSNPAHQKSPLVRITERGRTLLRSIREEEEQSLGQMLPHLGDAAIAATTDCLHRVRTLLTNPDISVAPANRPSPVTKQKAPRPEKSAVTPSPATGFVPPPAGDESPVEDFPVNLL